MANEIKVIINAKGVITGGKEVEASLNSIRNKAKQTQQDLERAVKVDVKASIPQLDQFGGALGKISSGLGLVGKAGIAATVLLGFTRAAGAAAEESEKLNNALLGLKSIAKATGNDMESVSKAAKELSADGLVPLTDVASGLKNLLAKGFSLQESIKLFQTLKDSAAFGRQGFLSMGEAIVGATEGLKNENSIMTDNAGITKNLSIMVKEYAATLGKNADALTEAQKRQAYYIGFLKEGERTMGDAAKLVDTYTGAKARLSVAIDRATAALGDFITKSELVKGAMSAVADILERAIGKDAVGRIKDINAELSTLSRFSLSDEFRKKALLEELKVLQQEVALGEVRAAQGEYEAKLKRDEISAIKTKEEAAAKTAVEETKRLKEVDKLKKQLIDSGKSEIDALKDLRDRRLALVKNDAEARLLIEKDYQDKKKKLEEKSTKQSTKLAKDSLKEIVQLQKISREIITQQASNPFQKSGNLRDLEASRDQLIKMKGDDESEELFKKIKSLDQKIDAGKKAASLGQGLGLAGLVTQGKSGAQSLVSGSAALGLDMLMPGLGEAAKPLLDAFTQGPEATRAMVKEFAKAIPDIVEGFIEAAPAFVEELANQTPVIIERLAEKSPDIIMALIKALPRVTAAVILMMPKIAYKFVTELIKNIPRIVSEIARAVYEAISRVLKQLNPFGSNGGGSIAGKSKGGVVGALNTGPTGNGNVNLGLNILTFGGSGGATTVYKSLKKKLGFAQGGMPIRMARGGAPYQDSIPAEVQQGEVVIDRTLTSQLKKQLDDGSLGGGADLAPLLKEMISLLKLPMEVQSDVKFNNDTMAKIILNLNRTNQRLA